MERIGAGDQDSHGAVALKIERMWRIECLITRFLLTKAWLFITVNKALNNTCGNIFVIKIGYEDDV